jgi:hypothetical protein
MYAHRDMSTADSKFEAALAAATTGDALREVFQAKIAEHGYPYFDLFSFDVKTISEPERSCRFYLCNYMQGSPLDYLPRNWPNGDDVIAATYRSVVPIDYLALASQAPRTPANMFHLGLFKLWNVNYAWVIPLNTHDRLQMVTVYARNCDRERFEATRWRMFVLGAMLMDRAEAVLGAPEIAQSGPAADLTERELTCLQALRRGLSNAKIAEELGVSENTVR